MAVRFTAAARRAIDRALIEVEERGHDTLDPAHLLLGLLHDRTTPAAAALLAAGIDPERIRAAATESLRAASASGASGVEVDGATESILGRAHELSVDARSPTVSDVHVLAACAASPSTSAGAILASAGITAQRLLALDDSTAEPPPPDIGMDGAADFLARAESWIAEERAGTTLGMSLLPEEGVGPSAPARSARHVTHVGTGYDSHRFVSGGPLTLGGVVIPFEMSLAGHSDGDAVAHAITDAILGAAGAGDIGEMFPDSDPANRGRDSIEMLRAAVARVRDAGWSVQQVDVTVIAERPKLAPHRAAMCGRLAIALECAPGCVNVKGKTNEGMGWIGRGEGLACIAVATLTSARAL